MHSRLLGTTIFLLFAACACWSAEEPATTPKADDKKAEEKKFDTPDRPDIESVKKANEAYLAAKPGQAYALYFTDGGSVGLNLTDAAGQLDIRWIDIGTGEWGKRGEITGGGTVTITPPGKGHWVAAIVKSR